ncbi:MAG: ABC transporter ATP-binding protein [Chloroflexi bacterium]|nr:ABC transporter ATP-binding protein [Chloroflexota bacterium]MCY3583143.1 ABC transporter ATP-binding protein [Chloroflexota bacterium]MCY3715352.1 ABC transporter ATP-binding protein [Chloroflexota bacterium]MDE2649561.1 ABC transporter ATP-binding protein [Chloroflexota bacterium]MXX51196.1 ABC transporter ATP-binding protein [Chloroflexota bacterium]
MAAIFGGLQSDKYDRHYSDTYLFRRIGEYLSEHKRLVGLGLLGFLVVGIARAIRPVFISAAIDDMVTAGDLLSLILLVLAAIAISEYLFNYGRRRFTVVVIGRVVAQLRKDAFHAAIERDLAFYDRQKSGAVISRITSDTQEFGDVMLLGSDVVSQFLSVVILFAALLSYSVELTGILLLTMPMVVVAALVFRVLARIVTRQGARAMAVVNDNIQESVTGISVAKNFRQEAMIYNEFSAVNNLSYTINLRRGLVMSLVFPTMGVLSAVALSVLVWAGAESVLAGMISAGAWYLFIQGVDRFWFPFMNLASFWSQFQQGLSAAERIFALIDAENSVLQSAHNKVTRLPGRIQFDKVSFQYERGQPILRDFCLEIKPGENVAFVGHTGAGKSTIAKLITRYYEFQQGRIFIDGADIRRLDMQSYRARLGIVPQQPFLFSGTVLDNIRYGNPQATLQEIKQVAGSIGNGEWLDSLPDGLNSDVGERGAMLSVGQRQLVSLLRVLVQKPSIFILDEATASIDPFTESQIQDAIELILARSTAILIAHRLSTVRSADRIIVLRDGAIIEEGNHDQLLLAAGHYAELYNTYFRHQSLSYVEGARDMFAAAGS